MQYIYLLKNNKTNRIYVGRTEYPDIRYRQHIAALKAKRHTNELMQQDFDLYGIDSFSFEIIDQAENFVRTGREKEWMFKLKTYDKRFGYNYKDPIACSKNQVCSNMQIQN